MQANLVERKEDVTTAGASSGITESDTRGPGDGSERGSVISKKKSLMRLATVLKTRPTDNVSKLKPADGNKISGLVRSGFRRRKMQVSATETTGPSTLPLDSTNQTAEEADVSASLPVRQSTESDFSIMSDWTIADASDASFGLPTHDESERQYGGILDADGRSVKKKKSFAAAGVLLSKILHGPAKEKGREEEGGRSESCAGYGVGRGS